MSVSVTRSELDHLRGALAEVAKGSDAEVDGDTTTDARAARAAQALAEYLESEGDRGADVLMALEAVPVLVEVSSSCTPARARAPARAPRMPSPTRTHARASSRHTHPHTLTPITHARGFAPKDMKRMLSPHAHTSPTSPTHHPRHPRHPHAGRAGGEQQADDGVTDGRRGGRDTREKGRSVGRLVGW